MKNLFLLVLLIGLSGCSAGRDLFGNGRVYLPFAEVKRDNACPAFKKINCAPRIGHNVLRLNKAPFILRENSAGTDADFFEVLGTVFHNNDSSAAYPRTCSLNGAKTAFQFPADGTASLVDSNTDYVLKGKKFFSVSAGADLSSFLNNQLGFGGNKAEAVNAAVAAGFAKASTSDVSASFSMFSVRLNTDTFNDLFFGNGGRLAQCRQLLKNNPHYRFVDSISVFKIRKQTIVNKSVSNIQFAISAELDKQQRNNNLSTAEVDSVNKAIEAEAINAKSGVPAAAGVQFSFRRDVFESLESGSPDYFIVGSVSFVNRSNFLKQHPSNSVW